MGKFWNRATLAARVLAVLWVLAAAATAALQAAGLVPPELPKLEPYAWAISLAIIGVDNAATIASRWIRREDNERKAEIRTALTGLLIELSKSGTMRFQELGASVYLAPRWWNHINIFRTLQLSRYVRERPAQYPQKSAVAWTAGKGNVGACWQQKASQYLDCHARARTWSGPTPTPQEFEAMTEAERSGMTYSDFVMIAKKYSEVYAEPIMHPSKEGVLIGVLSIDRAYIAGGDTFETELHPDNTATRAAATAVVVGRMLR